MAITDCPIPPSCIIARTHRRSDRLSPRTPFDAQSSSSSSTPLVPTPDRRNIASITHSVVYGKVDGICLGRHPRARQGVGCRRGPGNWHPLRTTPRERHRGSDDIRRQPRRRLQQHGGNRGNARRSTNRFQCDPRQVR